MQLAQFIGDSKTHRVPLTWDGEDFMPGNAWSLIFTTKRSAHDHDITAVFQKVSGAGIEVSGHIAEIESVPSDTLALTPTLLVWDIQAQNLSSGEVRTVALGSLKLVRDVTHKTTSSVEIHTIQPGAPMAGKSAYDVAVENGFVGSESQWLASLVGANGETELAKMSDVSLDRATLDSGSILTYQGDTNSWSNAHKISESPYEGATVVSRDEQGRISATALRLTNGTVFQGEINASPGMISQNRSYTLPNASGTFLLDTTIGNSVVKTSGDQTIAGQKSFTGQMELSNQAAQTGASVMNRFLADARYGQIFKSVSTTLQQSYDTTPIVVASVSLPVGTYQFDSYLAQYAENGPANCTVTMSANLPIRCGLSEFHGGSSVTNTVVNGDNVESTSRSSSGSATEFRRTLTGIVEVFNLNTTLSLSFNQTAQDTMKPSFCRKRAYIIARKIG
jgi:hypothetical protein